MAKYIVNEEKIKENVLKLKDSFQKKGLDFQLFYSVKSNFSREVLKCIKLNGSEYEIVSDFEWDMVKEFQPESLVLNGPGKSVELVSEILKIVKILYFNIDNDTDFEILKQIKPNDLKKIKIGLRNKSYYIFNQPYSKEEYQKQTSGLRINTYSGIKVVKEKFEALKQKQVRKYATLIKCERSTGDNMQNVADVKNCFDLSGDVRNCKFIQNGVDRLTDSYDGYGVGAGMELLYEAFDSGVEGSRQLFCMTVYGCHDATYCFNCHGCGNIFGCI